MHRHIIVGMSGGVDSSVAAMLLKQGGDEVRGVFMKNWDDNPDGPCPAEQDARDALSVCATLGIDLDAVNFVREYRERVFALFLAEYRLGRTPNPDILCNQEVKFKAFLDYALAQGAGLIATGHYARIERRDGLHFLCKGRDENKDQSYFLHTLNQYQLAHAEFPLGALLKPDVRRLARDASMVVHDKKDSTGICFIGERHFRSFLARYLKADPGEIRDHESNAIVGEHAGLMFYTLGQRQGLGIGGRVDADERPWYVSAKSMQDNILYVVQGHDHPALFSDWLETCTMHWITGTSPAMPLSCHARIRYRQQDQACEILQVEGQSARVVFAKPQWAVTPGQSIVFYDGEVCLGGGVIDQLGQLTVSERAFRGTGL